MERRRRVLTGFGMADIQDALDSMLVDERIVTIAHFAYDSHTFHILKYIVSFSLNLLHFKIFRCYHSHSHQDEIREDIRILFFFDHSHSFCVALC